jgi:uncharacterized membrane protein YhaH (DUF805 family)
VNEYLTVLKKYATFSGRARRKEFWMFVLINFIIMVILSALDMALGIGLLSGLYALGVLIPSLAVGARRLHDIGRTGWWQLIGIIPLIGLIVLIIFFVMDSNPGDNEYGPNPKGA